MGEGGEWCTGSKEFVGTVGEGFRAPKLVSGLVLEAKKGLFSSRRKLRSTHWSKETK